MTNDTDDCPLERAEKRRDSLLKNMHVAYKPLSDEQRETILVLTSEGVLITELVDLGIIPAVATLHNALAKDAAFATAFDRARADGINTLLSVAQHNARTSARTHDADRMRVAEGLIKVTALFAEKISPRSHGQLVKLADADGGRLSVNVVNYIPHATPLQSVDFEQVDTPRGINHAREVPFEDQGGSST